MFIGLKMGIVGGRYGDRIKNGHWSKEVVILDRWSFQTGNKRILPNAK